MPFQKGPCGEGGRMRGFLLPLLEDASVVVSRSFTHFFWSSPLTKYPHLLHAVRLGWGDFSVAF